ncbi:MAG: hypothetical protein R2726_02765 [Acidimicrobiales bacterium]
MAEELPSRRRFLGTAVAAGGAAWVAPSVLSLDAAAAATCLPPTPLGSRQSKADGSAGGTVTITIPVPSGADPPIPTAGTNVAHVAIVNIDHIKGVALPSAVPVEPGWTQLGSYDSDVTTPGSNGAGSTGQWSQRVVVFARTSGLLSAYQFSVTLTGNGVYTPQARVVVAAYQHVRSVANDPGELAMQGSGLLDPTLPPPPSNLSPIPAITTNRASTVALAFTGAGNVSSSNTEVAPAGYTLDIAANDGLGYPPIFVFRRSVTGPGTIPATTGTVLPGAQNVGGQLSLEC